ncbi:amidase [Haloactinomyces albus]|uniref:Aspartyl-tRNA(Asn)/glutamyl-tRNA(Gln) amidotransferase subunit A n=1 Tax=Haloactinomyces albus TaxID=1352928 RepID=A0AAE3ZJA5_9ACTN|nr:amidase [Haloactinomyces albus]MDR7304222.1 aspartyl-tRNA(Asn)/glutamyl-tRNA(Gln) amidotransferase subunit A [Haloactinomyces albus]
MTHATNPADLGVFDAAALLRTGALSAVELLDACEQRITERNGGPPTFDGAPDAVNAWARLYPDLSREQARAADERLRREGAEAPALCGIPLALKDLYAVAGRPLTASSRVLDGHVPDHDSVAWTRLREAGMVLLGHTHTHEFATSTTTDQVGNPHALEKSAGGSSGGSAAALAAGMVPAALGTDTAGSLRIPAALSGVSSIKPTHGRVPLDGIIPLSPTFDHPGPMARSLADCAALLEVLAAGGAETTPLMPPPAPLTGLRPSAPTDRPLTGMRIALTDRPHKLGVESEIADGLDHAARACAELGAEVVELGAAAGMVSKDYSTLLFSEMTTYHQRFADREADYRPGIREVVEFGRLFTSLEAYLDAQRAHARLTATWEEWFTANEVDVILEPSTPRTSPPRGDGYEQGRIGTGGDPLIRLTALWNATGFPVAAIPAGTGSHSGLPVGISLIAPRGAEARAVRIGTLLQEHALPPQAPTSPVPDADLESQA